MATQYVTMATQDLGAGIDAHSSEDQIKEGYSQDLLNCVIKENYLSKRKGYQLFAGGVPLRVLSVVANGTDLALTFDSTVSIDSELDLTNVRASPVLIYGKMSNTTEGDFPNTQNSIHYYTDFRANPRKTFDTIPTPVSLLSSEFAGTTPYLFVGTTRSLSLIGNSNETFIPDTLSINQSTFDVIVGHSNQTSEDFVGFVYVNQKPIVTGDTYVGTFNTSTDASFSIPAATHNLSNFSIMARVYQDNGVAYSEIIPDSLSILSDGTVTGSLVVNTTDFDFIVLLSTAPISKTLTGTASAQSAVSVLLTDMETDFIFADCYLEDLNTGTLSRVIPDSISVDADTKQATIVFTNNSLSEANFKIIYEYATLKTNKLTVQMGSAVTPGVSDSNPQLTVWGLDHEDIYPGASQEGRAGWVTHLDSYRRASDARMICGLGWNFFASYSRNEFRPNPEATPELISSTFLLPSYYPRISERILSSIDAGPAFAGNTGTYVRTRGFYKFDGGEEGWAKGVSVAWDDSQQLVKYTCQLENFSQVVGTGSIISIDTDLGDYVTIRQAPFSIHNGTFKIASVSVVTSGPDATLTIWINNPEINSSDYDGQDCGMDVGIFTEVLEFVGDFCPFLPADLLYSEDIAAGTGLTVLSTTTSGIRASALCAGLVSSINIPAGLRVFGDRTTNVLPLRTLNGTASALNFVRNDSVQITGLNRLTKIKAVIPTSTISFTLAESVNGVATVTLASAPNWVKPGIFVPMHEIGAISGTYEIQELLSATQFTIAVENAQSRTGRIAAHFIQIDEVLRIRDDQRSATIVEVPTRWIPIETPEDEYAETPLTQTKTLSGSYTSQSFVRSAMAVDNLYLTNDMDAVLKYDGRDIYHAGIPRWQPGLFSSVVTGSGVAVETVSAAFTTGTNGSAFKLTTAADANKFLPLDLIGYDASTAFTVQEIDAVGGFIKVTPTIPVGVTTGTLSLLHVYKYYFRLEYVDANGATIPGAAVQSDDFIVKLSTTSEIHLRLVGLPQFGPRDYDRLVLKVFRTKRNGAAPFYEVGALPLEYNTGDTYIDFVDTRSDVNISEADVDGQSVSIARAELPTAITLPQRALYITSTDNRLLLANLTTYAELSLQIDKSPNVLAADLHGKVLTFTRPSTNNASAFTFISAATTPHTITSVEAASGVVTISHSGVDIPEGSWVYLFRSVTSATTVTPLMGWHQVTTSSPGSFTFLDNVENIGSVAPGAVYVDRCVFSATAVPVWIGADGNYVSPQANLIGSNYRGIAMKRLAEAINSHQRQQGTTAWLTAAAGQSYAAGQIVVNAIAAEEGIALSVNSLGSITWFLNGVRQLGVNMYAFATAYPSRMLVSYRNKPEVFDAPTVNLDTNSDSAIDVNPSDGQEITGIMPFFGEAAYGAAQKSAIIAVFKSNSIYVIDLNAKALGNNPVQKIDSQGIGCTAPYSLAHTREGIAFANEGGIYRLNHDLTVEFLGQPLERFYGALVNTDKLSIAQGHNYAQERRYHFSFPTGSEMSNSQVFAFDHSREQSLYERKVGAWTRFTNFPSTGWANLNNEAYMASTKGKVYSLRNAEDVSDYRDDETAISMKVDFRAMDFGEAGVRKNFPHVLLRFRNGSDNLGTFISTATNLSTNFVAADRFILDKKSIDALSDLANQQIYTIRFSVYDNRGMFLQVRLENAQKDEPCDVTQLAVKVAGLKVQGTVEARSTSK